MNIDDEQKPQGDQGSEGGPTPGGKNQELQDPGGEGCTERGSQPAAEMAGDQGPGGDLSRLSPEHLKKFTEKRMQAAEQQWNAEKEPKKLSEPDIKEMVERRIAEEEEQRRAESREAAKKPLSPGEVDSKFVLQCLDRNESGDGLLYASLHAGKYVYNTTEQSWFVWAGHHWKKDHMNSALSAVENVSERYLKESLNIAGMINEAVRTGDEQQIKRLSGLRELINKRVFKLRSQRGRQNCLSFSQTQMGDRLAVSGDCFDLDPWALACKNGVVNLRTGELRPGIPEEYILRACPHDWKGINEPAPEWVKFLNSTFDDDSDLISFIQRYFGYSITGLNVLRKFAVLHGRGQNGKGVLVELLRFVLGSLAAPIQSELLLDQGRSRSSAGPSPDIMALKGLRMAIASESDEGRRFSSSRVKWLSGGDELVGRSPHAKAETSFMPSHKLFLLTNNKPRASAADFALWERMILIPFQISFVNRAPISENERPADLYLFNKLKSEAPGILAWLVRGCIAWQERGLDPPPVILDATSLYRREEDYLSDFIEECCEKDPDSKVGASELYDAFCEWYERNVSKKGISQRKFGGLMRAAGFKSDKHGTYIYYGLRLLAG